ncbi:hypothetical protein BXU06_11795 [Aquaspirillum sp. LM1]|nr:hypothetical protein BXU06_11795 [Aquaspirillum sp. LM1]
MPHPNRFCLDALGIDHLPALATCLHPLPIRTSGDILLAAGIHLREARFEPARFDPNLFILLNIARPDVLRGAAPARLAEFLAGRYCAGHALLAAGRGWTSVPVGAQREPCWPVGVCGTISHTRRGGHGHAIAAVAHDIGDRLALGVDLEDLIDDAAQPALAEMILDAQEQELRPTDEDPARWLTLAFSAKESLFKAVFPDVRSYLDFQVARLVTAQAGWFCLRLMQDIHPRWRAGQLIWGRYQWSGIRLTTLLVHPDPDAPAG